MILTYTLYELPNTLLSLSKSATHFEHLLQITNTPTCLSNFKAHFIYSLSKKGTATKHLSPHFLLTSLSCPATSDSVHLSSFSSGLAYLITFQTSSSHIDHQEVVLSGKSVQRKLTARACNGRYSIHPHKIGGSLARACLSYYLTDIFFYKLTVTLPRLVTQLTPQQLMIYAYFHEYHMNLPET